MHKLVLVRHGESIWNRDNKFTGWTDVDLTEKGTREAHTAAKALREKGLDFDVAFTSVLKRAIRTLWLVMDDMDRMWIPVHRSWRLNERMYGGLQGWDKAETAREYGDEQVHTWRRSYDVRPPELEKTDARHPVHDPKYAHLSENEIPAAESLKDTIERFMPYWHGTIAPVIQKGQRVIISAHGNSLRGLVKHLDGISDQEIPGLNIPTGIPLIYELDEDLKPLGHYYLADEETVQKASEAVADQGRAKK